MSYTKHIVCQANSKKLTGRCVGGKKVTDEGYGDWITFGYLSRTTWPCIRRRGILIGYEVKEALKDAAVRVITPFMIGDYDGNEEWNIAAKDNFMEILTYQNSKIAS